LSVPTRLHGAAYQKTGIFILIAVRTWNLTYSCSNITYVHILESHGYACKYQTSLSFLPQFRIMSLWSEPVLTNTAESVTNLFAPIPNWFFSLCLNLAFDLFDESKGTGYHFKW
jgi:hypothetical protein